MERNVNGSMRMVEQMLAGGRPGVEPPSEELEPERFRLVRRWFVEIERYARELRLDPGDPAPGAIEQLVLVVHEPAARHQDAQVRALIAILPGPGDPQVEGLRLVGDGMPVRDAPVEAQGAGVGRSEEHTSELQSPV